jgi:ubiquinol-cytochrome c reductase cytochrome b subunit
MTTTSESAIAIRAWARTTVGIVAILLLVQFLTGVLLAFYYVPSVDHAYTTVAYIEKVVASGSWVRSLHHYGSQWLTVFAFVHMIQLFLTKAYVARRNEWLAGVVILGFVLAAGGTGYSLPWDARAFFSTRVAEGLLGGLPFVGRLARLWLLGGAGISTLTLSRFFALHVLVIPALIVGVVVWRVLGARIASSFDLRIAIAAGLVFVALALWCLKYPAPFGPSVTEMTAEYLPRPGSQFLWLYQLLKYIPGGLGSIAGVVLPGIALAILIGLPWLKSPQVIGGAILVVSLVLVVTMTLAAYLDDRGNPQLARQAEAEKVWRREPFKPARIGLTEEKAGAASVAAPVMYDKFCSQCHGKTGEGARVGGVQFPPLVGVAAKPRRTVADIVRLLKDPKAYGLEPPMRSFTGKLSEEQMKEVAEFVVKLK